MPCATPCTTRRRPNAQPIRRPSIHTTFSARAPMTADHQPPSLPRWRVLKFGGTSVRDVERMRAVARIVADAEQRAERIVVVVSAMGGITDQLVALAASEQPLFDEVLARHLEAAAGFDGEEGLDVTIRSIVEDVRASVQTPGLEAAQRSDEILALGERLSSELVAAALREQGRPGWACDLRPLVRTTSRFGAARVRLDPTLDTLRTHFESGDGVAVATGFVGSTRDGHTTTLGRGGSDLTAALLGAALGAEEIEIWTDVDGVMSADPRIVADAFSVPELSYEEVMELAHFGAKVLYPPTVAPARDHGVPLSIRNTLNPQFPGTRIAAASSGAPADAPRTVSGITSIPNVALLRLEGSGLHGVTGIAHRLFGALARADCNVILISQASSEHSICCAVAPDGVDAARRAVDAEFAAERRRGRVQPLVVETDMSVVAVVGEGMRERPGVAASVFAILGEKGVNVRAIAQGSSELNISMVVARADRERAVRLLHGDLFVAAHRPPSENLLEVLLVGPGGVGAELARMIAEQPDRLRLVGVANSERLLVSDPVTAPAGASPADWRRMLRERGGPGGRERLELEIAKRGARAVLVDCTASARVPELYPLCFEHGAAVVAANKVGLADVVPWTGPAGPFSADSNGDPVAFGFEATVGAGLPTIATLRTLLEAGDEVKEISGVFSGTLGYLVDRLRQGDLASGAIRAAFDAGYTEPDPRDDLSGLDVARKLLILARMAGANIELDDVDLAPLVPVDEELDLDEFWAHLPRHDEPVAERFRSVAAGRSLAYLARVTFDGPGQLAGPPTVGLVELDAHHPACQLQGADNVFVFRTRRYDHQPLVIRGPGAGTEVTAGGVMGDLLTIQQRRFPRRFEARRPR